MENHDARLWNNVVVIKVPWCAEHFNHKPCLYHRAHRVAHSVAMGCNVVLLRSGETERFLCPNGAKEGRP